MSRGLPTEPGQRWQEVLRRAAIALKGRGVGVWEADAGGRLQLLAASSEDVGSVAADELAATLRTLGELPAARRPPHRWVASRLTARRWCVAPIRSEPPLPPPGGAQRRALAGESVSYQIRLTDRCYDAHVEPLRDHGGAIVGAVGLAVDVSDREQALAQARRSQLELEDFVEHAPVGIRWMAPDGTILRANPAELNMLGYRHDEYVGKNVAEFHLDPEVFADTLRRLRAGETVGNIETRLRHRNGSVCYGLLGANARFEGGEFIHARCVTRDITERKLAELALLQYQAMVQSADAAVI